MSTYHFVTHWRVKASCEDVYRLLEDVDTLAEWWPSVYLDVCVTKPGQPGGVGKEVALLTKGWLPYTLRWQFRVVENHFPTGFSLEAWGDFKGHGVWTFSDAGGGFCDITYDWKISAEKPLLKHLTWLLRPIFSANHHWAMRQGERSLNLELLRRRVAIEDERNNIPPPPRPVFV
ncbi:MAG: SRPBCC family protein [Saprospiraceae bacterium]